MSCNFQIIQLQINEAALKALPNRQRNQLIACMHAHNELAVMNRLLMFCLNAVAVGELHDHAQGVQMWCVMQVRSNARISGEVTAERRLKIS